MTRPWMLMARRKAMSIEYGRSPSGKSSPVRQAPSSPRRPDRSKGPRPTEHPEVAWTLNDLAKLYLKQEKTAEAERAYQRALSIREKVRADHPDVAETLEDYAALLRQMGRADEAEQMESRAESIRANK